MPEGFSIVELDLGDRVTHRRPNESADSEGGGKTLGLEKRVDRDLRVNRFEQGKECQGEEKHEVASEGDGAAKNATLVERPNAAETDTRPAHFHWTS
jgi:hypothetical protein